MTPVRPVPHYTKYHPRLRALTEGSSKLDLLMGKVSVGDFIRADGNCVCGRCGRNYRQYPAWDDCGTFHLLCDGTVIKT